MLRIQKAKVRVLCINTLYITFSLTNIPENAAVTIRERLLPFYARSILSVVKKNQLSKYLHDLIIHVSIEEEGWSHIHLPLLEQTIADVVYVLLTFVLACLC